MNFLFKHFSISKTQSGLSHFDAKVWTQFGTGESMKRAAAVYVPDRAVDARRIRADKENERGFFSSLFAENFHFFTFFYNKHVS